MYIAEVPGQILKPTSPKTAWRSTHLFCGTPGWKFSARKRYYVKNKEKYRVTNTISQELLGYCRNTGWCS